MSSNHKYFLIALENVPANPCYTTWFATWSTERPIVAPGMAPPLVVGVTSAETLPVGAMLLGAGGKDPPPPPPPLAPSAVCQLDYQKLVSLWLAGDRDEDE
jgi:hypothetical protein